VTPRDLEAVPLHPPELGAFIEFGIHDRDVFGRWRLEEGIVAQTPPLVEPLGITEEAAEVNGPTGPPAVEIRGTKSPCGLAARSFRVVGPASRPCPQPAQGLASA
jgi:hypothetical protein